MTTHAGSFRIGKRILAAGLFWQPAPSAARAAREARLVAAKAELAADLFCVRKRGTPQFGLGAKGAGHKAGMHAAAALLANAIPEANWTGIFAVDTGWFSVTVRKNTIMPDGDLLCSDEATAFERLKADIQDGGWDVVFAPVEWQIDGSRFEPLSALLSRATDAKLRPVAQNPVPIYALAAVLVTLAAGTWLADVTKPAPRVPDVPVAPPPPPPPWQGRPDVRAFIDACQSAIESVRPVAGFEIEMIACGSGGVTALYRRQGGLLSWLPKGWTILSPDRVQTGLPLPAGIKIRPDGEQPATLDMVRRRIWGGAQSYALDSELTETPVPPGAALLARTNGETPTYRTLSISLGSRLPATVFASVLASLPAYVVEEVVWQQNGWRVKGKAYVR